MLSDRTPAPYLKHLPDFSSANEPGCMHRSLAATAEFQKGREFARYSWPAAILCRSFAYSRCPVFKNERRLLWISCSDCLICVSFFGEAACSARPAHWGPGATSLLPSGTG